MDFIEKCAILNSIAPHPVPTGAGVGKPKQRQELVNMESREFQVPRLGDPSLDSPIRRINFVSDDAKVSYYSGVDAITGILQQGKELPAFEVAGPRAKIFHDPSWSRAAILTAGGLCPGLNDVIKFLVLTLKRQYNVPLIYGIRYGYRGLNPKWGVTPVILTEDSVDEIHETGGTILSSSRGQEDEKVMVDTLLRMNINILFCIGGDGTLRCAHAIAAEIKKRKCNISVIGIPKTIDNDVSFIDRSFGFETAVYASGRFITDAHNEAKGAYNGIGLIKIMGRDSGFIAAYATLSNSNVNYCLVPENPFTLLDGEKAFLPNLERRMEKKHHAVIIVSEGAGQEFFNGADKRRDASGNILHNDIGIFLKEQITAYFKERGTEVNIKYFDPSYSIRSGAARGTDAVFCSNLAQAAVHAAMLGRTDMVVGHWSDSFTHVPIALATRERKKIDINGSLWNSVKAVTYL